MSRPVHAGRLSAVACGIPHDVRLAFHACFLQKRRDNLRRFSGLPKQAMGRPLGTIESDGEALSRKVATDDSGLSQYLSRCQQAGLDGTFALYARCQLPTKPVDCFAEVRKRYLGKPDELYRRRTARRYAVWRRNRDELRREMERKEMFAEKEMKRRRGSDRLHSDRAAGDASFVPFMYEPGSHAYAFSSKITEAPKLRKVMVERYSQGACVQGESINRWERAKLAAETNPMFHNKVMNRFS